METKKKKDYDIIYCKVLGMSNSGNSYREIATAMHLPLWKVIDIVQKGYGRNKLYEMKRAGL